MACFSGFRPFLTRGSTVNGIRNIFFSTGSPGFHYLPNVNVSDVYSTSTLASFGSSINSIVDKKIGATIGTEIVSNGSFSGIADGTDVTTISGWNGYGVVTARDIQGEKLRLVTTTTNTGALYVFTAVIGKTYQVLFEYSGDGIGNVYTNTAAIANQTINASVPTSFLVTAAQTVMYLFFRPNGNNPGTGYYDNISIREVSGNPAVQSTSALRPLIGRAPRIRTNLIESSEDLTTWVNASVTTTADKVMETSTVEMHVSRAPSQEIYFNTDYYFTVEVKAAEKNYAVIGAWWTGGVAAGGIIFNLTTGLSVGDWARSPGNVSATFISSENIGDGWWRVKVYINNLSNVIPAHPIVGLTNSTATAINEVYAGTNGHGVFVRKAHASITPFTTYQKTESNRLITTDSTQTSYPFIRLDLSDDVLTTANLISAKNLLRFTEEFDSGAWPKSGVFITSNAATAPDGTQTADKIVATNGHVGGKLIYQSPGTASNTHVYSFYAKAAEYYLVRAIEAGNFKYYATFNLNTGVVSASGGANFVSAQMLNVGDGWYRCAIFVSATTPGSPGAVAFPDNITPPTNVPADYTGDGVSGAYFWGAQLEPGTNLTDYDYGGTKGTVLVAGKNGTAIETVYSPDGNFSLGPTTYTSGTPGMLRAVGDIVGYTLTGRLTTVTEQDQLLDLYKFRGAKGRFVEGPELFNFGSEWMGSFNVASSNSLFYTSGPTAAVSFDNTAGTLTVTQGNNVYYGYAGILLNSERQLTAGKMYKVTVRILSVTVAGWGSVTVHGSYSDANTLGSIPLTVTQQPQIRSFIFISGGSTQEQLRLYVGGPLGTAVYDYVSIKEIRPEEEW